MPSLYYGIKQLDASGKAVLHQFNDPLPKNGITFVFSGLKGKILEITCHSSLIERIGKENLYPMENRPLEQIEKELGEA